MLQNNPQYMLAKITLLYKKKNQKTKTQNKTKKPQTNQIRQSEIPS